ncbi:MAG: Bug family tripartite tricarboxylate transporter substrate binding protein [Burkholderiales bacterium]
MKRRLFNRLAMTAAVAMLACNAIAEEYPARPVTLIVPFATGGALDAMARVIGSKMSDTLGQSVVIDNRAGASGVVGMNVVARAKPDGYTILYTPNSIAIGPALYRKLPFDAEKDFIPVTQLLVTNLVVAAHPKTNLRTVKDLVSMAKANPGKLNFGSSGVADPLQLGMEMLKTMAGIQMVAVPYKGQAPMFQALLAGEVDVAVVSIQLALAPIKSGKLNVLAAGSPKRLTALPDVPTVAETGYPGYEIASWHALFAPAGTPRAIVERLQREAHKAVNHPEVRKRVEATGNEIVGSTPTEFAASFKADVARFKKIARDARLPYQD